MPTMEPWVLLNPRQKALYRDVLHESYETLMSLGEQTQASPSLPQHPPFSLLFPVSGEEAKGSQVREDESRQVSREISPNPVLNLKENAIDLPAFLLHWEYGQRDALSIAVPPPVQTRPWGTK